MVPLAPCTFDCTEAFSACRCKPAYTGPLEPSHGANGQVSKRVIALVGAAAAAAFAPPLSGRHWLDYIQFFVTPAAQADSDDSHHD
jgi:hypothetical protein